MGSPFVANLTPSQAALLKERLLDKGFELKNPAHTLFQARGEGVSCTVYLSGKIVVQGKASKEFIEFFLEPEFLFQQADLFETTKLTPKLPFAEQAHIGSDESGKGDFVGPLCVVALYANQEDLSKLQSMGVRDSKTLDARSIGLLAKQLRSEFIYHAVILKPEKYNELYASFKNLNKLLAWAHCAAIRQLVEKTGCRQILIDKFAHESVMKMAFGKEYAELEVVQQTKAESDLVVAAASILARQYFVEGMQELYNRTGIDLKKGGGSSATQSVQLFVNKYGAQHLKHVVKMHFKNLDAISKS